MSRRSRSRSRRGRSSCCSSMALWRRAQQRNLETETGAKVLDRTALILEIFGERAATREGVLQVELAHLNYQKSRLVRSWTHLERQRGGFGFLGGPGETQIESDRRLLEDRIKLLEERLEKVKHARPAARQSRGGADPGGGAGRLHQCRQVEPVQPADRGRGVRRRSAVRDARHDAAEARSAAWAQRHGVGHGGLRVGTADDAGRRLPRDARGKSPKPM